MAIIIGVFGALVGSFLNVVIYRIPLKRSIVSPPSTCTGCGTRIKGYDNIPVFSWLLLRGKCRSCDASISMRYPIVDLSTGVFFGIVAWKFHGSTLSLLVAFLYLAAVSIALAFIDLDTHTLPNRIVIPSYIVGALLLGATGLIQGNYSAIYRALLGMLALSLFYFGMALIYPGGMGMGDVKFAGVLGLFLGYLGWDVLLVGAFSAFVLGGFFALALIVLRKAKRTSGIPFGPWMLTGAWVGVFFSTTIVAQYLSLFGLGTRI
jgi:leader peptidase (prepilin peptidase)/N-methyltransferase